ncbi:MAG: hypothetical protein M9933_10420 [Chitinophagaceae bacterium]|nr:hypothetical protein [Chitinophagaceae bacterium]
MNKRLSSYYIPSARLPETPGEKAALDAGQTIRGNYSLIAGAEELNMN